MLLFFSQTSWIDLNQNIQLEKIHSYCAIHRPRFIHLEEVKHLKVEDIINYENWPKEIIDIKNFPGTRNTANNESRKFDCMEKAANNYFGKILTINNCFDGLVSTKKLTF